MDRLTSPLPFLEAIESLKAVKNSRWALHSSPESERLYDKMYQMALVCLAHPDLSGEDEVNAVIMCMVHDVGHVASGEVTLVDDKKYSQIGLKHLASLLKESSPTLADRLPGALLEYKNRDTHVAKLVRQIEMFETLHQAVVRRQTGLGIPDGVDLDPMRGEITDSWLAKQANNICLEDWNPLDETSTTKTPIIFVIGGSEIGDQTQFRHIAEDFGIGYISMDKLLREEQSRPGSIFGRFIEEVTDNLANFPPSLAITLLKSKVKETESTGKGVLIRGFPQSVGQVVAFEREISNAYLTIYLEHPVETRMGRARIGGELSQQEGDNTREEETLRVFESASRALLDHLSTKFLQRVDATGSHDEVYAKVRGIVRTMRQR
ncbi:adenylate kinase [Dactylonectria estremocensis]|uniref:Adenylate kinase n=1 Tax=Dactylonectria estremocensis TaxID=1079267 RepID=A0A9P9E415_9HYPO|nr:adenylate kinase [Dactylonectria estremocensis]